MQCFNIRSALRETGVMWVSTVIYQEGFSFNLNVLMCVCSYLNYIVFCFFHVLDIKSMEAVME